MPTNAITKQLHLYFGVDGTLLDKSGDVFANPQDDEIFEINAYIEDGVVNNQTTLINFTPNDRMAYTSHWFTMFYRELVDYIVPNESEPKTFAKFTIKVPSIVLLIKGGKVQFEQRITIVQRYGNTHLGNFATVTDLNVAYPPSETLDDNNDVAFVYSNESGETTQVGFYQVEYDGSNYAWIKKETLLYNLQTKQYNVLGFTVNVGMANPSGVPTISESVIYQLMQEISHVYIDINALEVQVIENKDLAYENVLLSTENDWDLETIFTEKFSNSRNGWVQVDNEFYVFGGGHFLGAGPEFNYSNEFSTKAYKYNAVTKQLTELSDFPIVINELRGVYKDGFIYLIGQDVASISDLDKTYKYEISTDTYTLITNPPVRIRYSSGAVLVGNKIYVFVDSYYTSNSQVTINTTPYIYDISLDSWSVGLPTNIKFDRGYAYYYNGLIYVQRSLKFQAYNPTTDTWITDLTPPTYGVVHTGLMHEYKGRLFIGSGWESAEAKNNPFIQYYDVTKDKWFVATRLEFKNHALGYGSMFLYDNKLYYIGGYSNEAEPNFNNLIRSFDLEKLQFEEIDYQRQLIQNNEDKIDNMLDGTTIVKKAEQDENGNDIVTTYETKSDATSKLALKADKTYVDSQDQALDDKIVLLETANMIKSVSRTGTNLITLTFYNNDTSNIVTLSELKTFIGNASTTLEGLMSAQDKTDLNTLMALFGSDPDSVVNTIAEILEIFQNYPEGADLVTVLAGKEDKANKATNFTVVNDEKYPSVKAVKDFVDSSVRNSLKIVDTETSEAYKLKLYVTNGQLGYEIEEE